MAKSIETYWEFWPHYLREHSKPATRRIHYLGTTIALLAMLALLITWNPWWLVAALIGGYGPAWIGHFFIEKNRPATFSHPFWSLYSDFRMYALALAGRLEPQLERAGASPTVKRGPHAAA